MAFSIGPLEKHLCSKDHNNYPLNCHPGSQIRRIYRPWPCLIRYVTDWQFSHLGLQKTKMSVKRLNGLQMTKER